MSVWTTKSSGRDREYIVLQHSIKGVNYIVQGVRFRDGYAVVEKNSKVHQNLLKVPALQNAKTYPLSFLKKLSFVTKSTDVRTVYGQDVYVQYLKEISSVIAEEKVMQENSQQESLEKKEEFHKQLNKCGHRLANGQLCGGIAQKESPSHYCHAHFFEDPKFPEMGINIPRFMTKNEKKALKEKIIKNLSKNK